MIVFREIDYQKDVENVVQLLNACLKNDHTKQSFLWKHYENPFGKSYGLIAEDNNRVVGVRMFMKWELQKNKKIIKALRPVDACTASDYRGKGLFKKLTEKGLEDLKASYDLIFNTSNENSKPLNLKMGWKLMEKDFRHTIGVLNIFGSRVNFRKIKPEEIEVKTSFTEENVYQTSISSAFFKWRYAHSEYKTVQFETGEYFIYKISWLKGAKAIILMDCFGAKEHFQKCLRSICFSEKAFLVYYMNNKKSKSFKFLFNLNRHNQDVLVKEDGFKLSEEIEFSLGDLEGKL